MSSIAYTRARYRPSATEACRGNAFIEALPQLPQDPRQLADLLRTAYAADPQDDDVARDALADRIAMNSFICLPRHVRLFRTLDELLREGYRSRPASATGAFRSFDDYRSRAQQGLEAIAPLRLDGAARQASYISLIGCHGSGKTHALRRMLSFYPQVIYHHRLSEGMEPLQVVHLHLTCRKGQALRDLYLEIITQMGALTGQDFGAQLSGQRLNPAHLRRMAQRLIAGYHLGLLVIDQLEYLMDTRSRRDELFDFIHSCARRLATPLVLVAATRILNHARRDGRIAGFFGRCHSCCWQRFTPGSSCYRSFLRSMWSQQPLANNPRYVPREFERVFYHYSQGIVIHLVSLFALSVKLALAQGSSYLTPAHVRQCYELYFDSVHAKITALQEHNAAAFRRLQAQTFSHEQLVQHCAALSARIRETAGSS